MGDNQSKCENDWGYYINIYRLPVAPCGKKSEEWVATSHAVPLANVNRVVSQTRIYHMNVLDEKSFLLKMYMTQKNSAYLKGQKNGIFLFEISFCVFEILTFSYYAN